MTARRRRGVILATLASITVAVFGFQFISAWSANRKRSAEATAEAQAALSQRAPRRVWVETVERQPLRTVIEASGALRAVADVTILAESSGTVISVRARRGDRVHAGEVLLELDASAARLVTERLRLELALAEERLRFGRGEYKRAELLYRQMIGGSNSAAAAAASSKSPGQASDDEIRFDVIAETEFRKAEHEFLSTGLKVEIARAALAEAQRELDRRAVAAPFDGALAECFVELGDTVTFGRPLYNLVNDANLTVDISISEADLANLEPGAPAHLRLGSDPSRELAGLVTRISPKADPTTRAWPVTIAITDATGFHPGMAVSVEIERSFGEAMSIPESIIRYSATASRGTVFVVTGEQATDGTGLKAQATKLTLGRRVSGRVVVHEGLSPGDRVVVDWETAGLSDGDPIIVVSE